MTHTKRSNSRFEVVLRHGLGSKADEYVFATGIRRENGAIAERDRMVDMTVQNQMDHCPEGGRVIQGTLRTDPNAVTVTLLYPDGRTFDKVVTFRRIGPEPEVDLTDALLASLIAIEAGTL